MNIKIVGGSGYLGNRIHNFLECQNYNVLSSTRRKSNLNRKLIHVDLKSPESIDNFCEYDDTVIFSGGMNQATCNNSSTKLLNEEINNFYQFYDECLKKRIKKFIYISTSQVYSEQNELINEESNIFSKDAYTNRHIKAEDYILSNNNKNTQNYIIRLSNAFGPPVNPNTKCWHLAVNDFALNSVIKNQIKIRSDGKQMRNFVDIKYFCEAILFILKQNTKENNIIYNIGGYRSFNIYSLAKLVAERNNLNNGINTNIINKPEIKTNSREFSFSSKKIVNAGFRKHSKEDLIVEIDKLITFCNKHQFQ